MSVIKIAVNGQNLTFTEAPKIASEGVNEDTVEFNIDSALSGFALTALFWKDSDEDTVYSTVLNSEYKGTVPWEVTDEPGKIWIGLCGVSGDVIYTSEVLKYKIVKGKYSYGTNSQPPTPDMYQQILNVVSQMNGLYNSLRTELKGNLKYEADSREVGDGLLSTAIEVQKSRIDNLLENATTSKEDVLYGTSGDTDAIGTNTSYTLHHSIADYDYLDIYIHNLGNNDIKTIPADTETNFHIRVSNVSDKLSSDPEAHAEWSEIVLSFTGATMTIVNESVVYASGSSGLTAVNIASSSSSHATHAGKIYKVIGRKIGRTDNAELADIRTGADGTIYESAGNAVRGQVSGLQTKVQDIQKYSRVLDPSIFYTEQIVGSDWDTVTLGSASNVRRYTKTGNVMTIDSNLGSGSTYQAISIYGDEPWTLNANIASHLGDIPDSLFLPLPYLAPADNAFYQNILSLRYSVLNAPNIYGGPSGSSMGFIIVTKTSENVRTSYGLDFNSTSLNGVQTMRIAQISELPDVAANGNFAILLRTTRPNMMNTKVCWTLEVTLIDSPTRNAVVN